MSVLNAKRDIYYIIMREPPHQPAYYSLVSNQFACNTTFGMTSGGLASYLSGLGWVGIGAMRKRPSGKLSPGAYAKCTMGGWGLVSMYLLLHLYKGYMGWDVYIRKIR